MKRSKLFLLVLLVAGGIILSACSGSVGSASWPGVRLENDRIYLSYGTSVFSIDVKNGSLAWRFPAEANNRTQFFAPVSVGEDLLVVGDYANVLHGIDSASGSVRWSYSGAKGRWISGVLPFEEMILAPNADHQLYALNTQGEEIWIFKGAKEALWAEPVTDGKLVYQTAMDHSIYAINLQDGSKAWSMDLGGALVYAPLLHEGILYVATLGDEIIAIRTADQKILWRFSTSDEVWGIPVFHENALYFADLSGAIYGVWADTGVQIWNINAGGAIAGSAGLLPEGLVFATEAGEVLMVDFEGARQWTKTVDGKLYGTPAVGDDRVIVSAVGGENLLVAFDYQGNQVWAFVPPK